MKYLVLQASLVLTAFTVGSVHAALPPEEVAKLGISSTELTPLGAIRAGTEDGKVPAWEGGITTPPPEYVKGGWYPDPFKDDKPLFRITKDNYQQYADSLTDGQVAMLKTYPEYFMDVYPTRRSASYKDYVYEATMRNAREGLKTCGDRCIEANDYGGGFPFPILYGPDDSVGGKGQQIFWNGFVAVWGNAPTYYYPSSGGYLVSENGSATRTAGPVWGLSTWWIPKDVRESAAGRKFETFNDTARDGRNIWCTMIKNEEPARQAGTIVNNCAYAANILQKIFLYIPGQRRVRRAPELGVHDAPGNNSDGLKTSDQAQGYNMSGAEEVYSYKVHGRKLKFVPYNSYKLTQPGLKESDVVHKGYLNPALTRWELHRVWETEMTLKDGFRHLIPHRYAYVDEDTWKTVLATAYNARGELWRVTQNDYINAYDFKTMVSWADCTYDVLNGRWFVGGSGGMFNMTSKPAPPQFSEGLELVTPEMFTPQGLRTIGVR